jgi:hypothetical protein
MSMKSASAPRRVYVRNGIIHTLYSGTVFGTKESKIVPSDKETLFVRIEGTGDGKIRVTQRRPKQKGVTEVWGPVKVPSQPRA